MKSLIFSLLAAASVVGLRAAEPSAESVLTDMKRAADWQIANPSKHAIHDWTQAPYFLGLYNLHQVSGDEKYRAALDGFGKRLSYGPGPRVTHADDHAVLQAWLELYRMDRDYAKLKPSIAHFDKVLEALSDAPPKSISGGTFTWCWCDALFMSPAVWVHLSELTGDPKFLEWSDREWWTCTDILYDPEACLYYRDNRFFERRTETGRKVFWSRGNGWVVGGLVHVLDYLPEDHPSRERYLALYHDMMHALVKLQNPDGLWRTSLLDPEGPAGESSGSSFFTYAMAWGLNRGLLPEDRFRPAVMKGWQALAKNIQPDGMLGYVQKISDRPEPAARESTEVYGTGALLLAGAEIVRLFEPDKRRTDLATFEGVELPKPFLRAEPRVYARYVPERKDDFAWENDLIAFRTYGPALRSGAEDSGFDAWFKRVPYPILDKWYIEDRTRAPYGNVAKSYHADQGEGYDVYKVGNTRGVGGISLWVDGKLHNSDTFVAHRVVEQSPDKAIFELDYASRLDGKVVRETKRITVLMGQHLFQCESRFTIDGKAGPMDVAIGLKPQVDGKGVFSPDKGLMSVWETIDDLGFGQGVVVDPSSVVKMAPHTDGEGQLQQLCFARTDDSGYIRWFAGFGWEGRGVITTEDGWKEHLAGFAADSSAFEANAATLKVHSMDPPADPNAAEPVDGVPGAVRLKPNGGWCWYQGPRAILTRGGELVFTTISGDSYAGFDAGDLHVTSWKPGAAQVEHFELHDRFQRDDHDVAGLVERRDGRLLAVYGKHGNDPLQRWRISEAGAGISSWSEEGTLDVGAGYTYSNVFRLSSENGRLYNFHRGRGYNPNCTISPDDGESWQYGWRLLSWGRDDLQGNPRFTGSDGGRPYVRYASNGEDVIHFVTTDDHPRAYDNSIYHGFYRGGKLHGSAGQVLGDAGEPLKPHAFTEVFKGDEDRVAWTVDLELDDQDRPYTVFSVQMDGAKTRGKRAAESGSDHRFWYARFDGSRWHAHEIAHAGTKLYVNESDYTGLAALDPQDPDTMVISTDAHPTTGEPLISSADGQRHHELFRGTTSDCGKSWQWTALTENSTVDNLRPLVPSNPDGDRIILWGRGDLKSFTDYRLDVCALVEER